MAEQNLQFSPVRMKAASEEAAVQQALQIVGATRDQVDVEVVEQNEKGVTVRVSPRSLSASAAPATAAVETPDAVADEIAAPSPAPASTLSAPVDNEADDAEQLAASDAESNEEKSVEEPAALSQPIAPAKPVDPALRERVQRIAQEMLNRMSLEAQAELADEPFSPLEAEDDHSAARLYVRIEGDDVGILIGKHGQTLQSFQYLLNLTLNNRGAEGESEAEGVRVVVDAGGYRARRAEVLQQAVREAAERAKRDRRSVRLEPMPAHERRLVHLILRDDTSLDTGSEGREPYRHVIISPAGMRPTSGGSAAGGRGGHGGSRSRSGGYSGGGYSGGGYGGGYGGNRDGGNRGGRGGYNR